MCSPEYPVPSTSGKSKEYIKNICVCVCVCLCTLVLGAGLRREETLQAII